MPPAPAPHTVGDSIEARLAATERLLRDQTARIRRGTVLTLVVGLLLLGLMAAYFYYGYTEISSIAKPETLVQAAATKIQDQIPDIRKAAEDEVAKSAPVWAASLSQQAQSSLPTLREKLEAYAIEQVDQTAAQTISLTEAEFRRFLRENRETLEQGFRELATSPELADESLNRVQAALEARFRGSMEEGSQDMFATLHDLNSKIARLKTGQNLSQEEQLERQILMQARRLQLEQADPQMPRGAKPAG